jgi:CRP-like cAMP-binding protein
MKTDIDLLRSKALFGGLDDDRLKKICSFLEVESFYKGDIIIKEGEIGSKMYLLKKGKVEVLKYSREEKKEEVIAMLGEGDSFGEMELIDIQPRTATIKALEDIETISLNSHDLLSLSHSDLECFSIVLINIARIISRRLRKSDEMLVSIHPIRDLNKK